MEVAGLASLTKPWASAPSSTRNARSPEGHARKGSQRKGSQRASASGAERGEGRSGGRGRGERTDGLLPSRPLAAKVDRHAKLHRGRVAARRRRHAVEEALLLPRAIAGVHAPHACCAGRAGLLGPLQPLALLLCHGCRARLLGRRALRRPLRRPLLFCLNSGGALLSPHGKPLRLGLTALAQGGGVLCSSAVLRTLCPLNTQVVLRELRDFLVVRVLT